MDVLRAPSHWWVGLLDKYLFGDLLRLFLFSTDGTTTKRKQLSVPTTVGSSRATVKTLIRDRPASASVETVSTTDRTSKSR
jgi:hypothetical protein